MSDMVRWPAQPSPNSTGGLELAAGATQAQTEPTPAEPVGGTPGRLVEVGWTFLKLGCMAFGGPIAHLG